MFQKLEEDEALVVENGVYKPVDVYRGPEGGLFVKCKGGFVRAKANGSTSHPTVKLLTLQREGELYQDPFGRLCVEGGAKRRQCFIHSDAETLQLTVEDVAGSGRFEKKTPLPNKS